MLRSLLLSLVVLFTATTTVIAQQTDAVICGVTDQIPFPNPNPTPDPLRADGPTVGALVVLAKFRDDTYDPPWNVIDWPLTPDPTELPFFATGLIDPDPNPTTFRDSTLTRYFYDQSRPGPGQPGQETLYGNVVPYVHVSENDNVWYMNASGRGYGYLTKEALDRVFPTDPADTDYVYDPADYDVNADGVIDHVFMVIRSDIPKQNGTTGVSGCSWLGGLCGDGTSGTPASFVDYYSPSRAATVRLEWGASGSMLRGLPGSRWAYRPHLHYLRVMGHEYGHDRYGPHVGQNSFNDVPTDVSPTSGGNVHAMMATNFIQHDVALSTFERQNLGWVGIQALTTSRTVTLGDVYGSSEAAKVALSGVSNNQNLLLANRQRVGWFNQAFITPNTDLGLLETGLMVTLGRNGSRSSRDVIAADGKLFRPIQLGGYQGVMFGEDRVKVQLTPWTRPNSSGFINYPPGATPSWTAIDDIIARPDEPATFKYYEDYRVAPTVFIRNDSWMGDETDGTTFPNEVRVVNGATLTVEDGAALTFNGGIVVEDGASVVFEPGAVVTIGVDAALVGEFGSQITAEPGAEVRLDEDAKVDAFAFTATGTAANPVLFTQATPGKRWDRIVLRDGPGSSHDLQHVRIEGGTIGLVVRARNAQRPNAAGASLAHVHLVGNALGLLTDYASCPGDACRTLRSSVSLGQVLVEGSLTHGLYLRNTDFGLFGSTVRANGRHGVVVTNATATAFAENVIEGNGPAGSGYDGLRLGTNGSVDMSRRGDLVGPFPGLNRFADNADHQVAYLKGAYLFLGKDDFLGTDDYGGQNAITEAGAGCRVLNESGSVLEAENTYWGTSTAPPASYFCGTHSVDVSPFLTTDPTDPCAGNPSICRPAGAPAATLGRGSYTLEELAAEIAAARSAVAGAPGTPEAAGLVRRLGALHRLDEADATGELGATSALLEGLRGALGSGLAPGHQATAEQALVVEVEFALAAEAYAAADALAVASGAFVEGADAAQTLAINRVAVDEALGRYAEALARLDELLAAVADEEVAEDLVFLSDQIAAKLAEAMGGREGGAPPAQAAASRTDASLPQAFALGAAYPNPTARGATVPFDLPEAAEVRVAVYDLLGREVAVLAEGLHEAGRHRARFEVPRLASGVYVIRAEVAPLGGAVQAFTQKLTLLR